ncbi:MAG: ATP-grasp domain-containing protein, partial [Asgard group archaeon]|nr:ATP-grasp domain-containing protein [Asgard group archaeon]
ESLLIAKTCSHTLIIAPETKQCLKHLVENYQKLGNTSLNASPKAIYFTSSKKQLYRFLATKGLPIPQTYIIQPNKKISKITTKKKPPKKKLTELYQFLEKEKQLIIKPNMGTSCEGIELITTKRKLESFLINSSQVLLLQQYIPGEYLSVNTYCSDKKVAILSINKQIIQNDRNKIQFLGNKTNYKPKNQSQITNTVKQILEELPGLKGLVGVDIIMATNIELPVIIDINPRASTSICGILTEKNTAGEQVNNKPERIIKTSLDPNKTHIQKISFPKKIECTQTLIQKILGEKPFVTPPLSEGDKSTGLLMGKGIEMKLASKEFTLLKKKWQRYFKVKSEEGIRRE